MAEPRKPNAFVHHFLLAKQKLSQVRFHVPESVSQSLFCEKSGAIRLQSPPRSPTRAPRRRAARFTRLCAALFLTLLGAILIFALGARRRLAAPVPVSKTTQHLVYLGIPTLGNEGARLCKTVLSAQILGYPIPVLIPYGQTPDGKAVPAAELGRSRLDAVTKWVSSLPTEATDGMVMLLDGPSTWFQLRPDVLFSRWFDVGNGSVVFASQDSCASPNGTSSCFSPQGETPQYLGAGALLGLVSAVSPLLQRASELAQKGPSRDPTALFDEMYTLQQRERARLDAEATDGRITSRAEPSRFGHGIAVDYAHALGLSTSGAAADTAVFEQADSIPSDIRHSQAPFWTVSGRERALIHDTEWEDVELLHVASAGSIPAMIHHVPSGNTTLEQTWWPHFWLSSHARELYTSAQRVPASIVASVLDPLGDRHVYWDAQARIYKAGAFDSKGRWTHWEDLCPKKESGDVFGDDVGTWHPSEFDRTLMG